MRISQFLTAAAGIVVATAQGTPKGFNSGSTFTDGSPKTQSDFESEFSRGQDLDFGSVRLFTMIQGGTANTVISAIPAAINTNTRLLLGLWASAGQANFDNEIIALQNAISQYGQDMLDLIDGISVGSEDLYRISPTGIQNESGAGANPDELVSYINQVRNVEGVPTGVIGHVDTWTAYVNSSNNAVIDALDWVGMDAYPYFQSTINNGIDVASDVFYDALSATEGVSQGKPVWVTETGWPVSGDTQNNAVASVENAQTYYSEVGCSLFGQRPTWWYILTDSGSPDPSFGILPPSNLNGEPRWDLSCPGDDEATTAAPTTTVESTAAAPTEATTTAATGTVDSDPSPGPQTSPTGVELDPETTSASAVEETLPVETETVPAETVESTVATSVVATQPTGEAETLTSTVVNTVIVTDCSRASATAVAPPASTPEAVSPTTEAAPSAESTPAAPKPADDACQTNLEGNFEYPHLIVPVSANEPNKAYGTQYNFTITPDVSTIFNFDVPYGYNGMTCSLVFLLPNREVLTTSNYEFNGEGGFTVDELKEPATEATTFENKSEVAEENIGGVEKVAIDNSYVVATQQCKAGARQSFEFSSTGGLDMSVFNDYNLPGVGVFMTVC
ncbi:hypothetical protein MBLNU230_g5999t1 [Neophaeotheca triangularis]